MTPKVQLSAEQAWQSTRQWGLDFFRMTGKDDLGIEIAPIGKKLIQVPTPSGFWKRAWMRLFGPRPPPTFFVAIQRPPGTAVEVSHLRQVQPRDDQNTWTDLMVTFRFVPEKKERK